MKKTGYSNAAGLLVCAIFAASALSGCVAVHSSTCEPCKSVQVRELEERCMALEEQMQEQYAKIARLRQESGVVNLERIVSDKQSNVQSLRKEIFSLERSRAGFEAQVSAYEPLAEELSSSEQQNLRQMRLGLARSRTEEQQLRELLAREEADAAELGRKWAVIEAAEHDLLRNRQERERLLKQIDRLEGAPNPCAPCAKK